MSFTSRVTSALFTTLPAAYCFFKAVFGSTAQEYYWRTDAVVVFVLLGGSLLFGFVLPPLLRLLGLRAAWLPILLGGVLSLLLALFVMAMLNATPLCVGQDNGDGNNDFSMCMSYVLLAAVVFGSVYFFFLSISSFVGHWIVKGLSHQITSRSLP